MLIENQNLRVLNKKLLIIKLKFAQFENETRLD